VYLLENFFQYEESFYFLSIHRESSCSRTPDSFQNEIFSCREKSNFGDFYFQVEFVFVISDTDSEFVIVPKMEVFPK
jgi:hypothetical protein